VGDRRELSFGRGKHVRGHRAGGRLRINNIVLRADDLIALVNGEIALDAGSLDLELGSRQRTGCP